MPLLTDDAAKPVERDQCTELRMGHGSKIPSWPAFPRIADRCKIAPFPAGYTAVDPGLRWPVS